MNNRSRRGNGPLNKQFVPGGVYDGQRNYGYQQQHQGNMQQQGYQNQQDKEKPLSQQQQQPQRQQQPQAQQQQQSQINTAPLQPPPKPPKMDLSEPAEPTETTEPPKRVIDGSSLIDESGKLQFKKIFLARKKSSVRAKEKKIRQNRQLRKAIIPKNALMALHEVWGVSISEFTVSSIPNNGGFTAFVTVNNKQYEGRGNSKMAAKNNACEKALRDYILQKMREKPRLPRNSANNSTNGLEEDEAMDTTTQESNSNGDAQNGDVHDDMPMINLASFAIYKLFAEWENEGFEVPELHMSAINANGGGAENGRDGPPAAKTPKQPPIRTELPPNWETMHPATLLCMMRPGLTYTEYGAIGEKPNILQKVSVVADNVEYTGIGRSKKAARRNAAVTVCNNLFGTNFIKEEPCEAE